MYSSRVHPRDRSRARKESTYKSHEGSACCDAVELYHRRLLIDMQCGIRTSVQLEGYHRSKISSSPFRKPAIPREGAHHSAARHRLQNNNQREPNRRPRSRERFILVDVVCQANRCEVDNLRHTVVVPGTRSVVYRAHTLYIESITRACALLQQAAQICILQNSPRFFVASWLPVSFARSIRSLGYSSSTVVLLYCFYAFTSTCEIL